MNTNRDSEIVKRMLNSSFGFDRCEPCPLVKDSLKRGGKFFPLWIATTREKSSLRKASRMRTVNLPAIVHDITTIVMSYPLPLWRSLRSHTAERFSLYLLAKLMFGACVVLNEQAILLLRDLHSAIENLKKLRWSNEQNVNVRKVSQERKRKPHLLKQEHGKAHLFDGLISGLPDEAFLISDAEQVVPLEFGNAVLERSVTMTEDISIPRVLDEDLRFGDEDDPQMLRLLLNDAGDSGQDFQMSPTGQKTSKDTVDFDHEPLPNGIADTPQDSTPNDCANDLCKSPLPVELKSSDNYVSASVTFHHSFPTPIASEKSKLFQSFSAAETRTQDASHANDMQLSNFIEVSDVRRRTQPKPNFKDTVIEISNRDMLLQMRSKSFITLRKKKPVEEFLGMKLKQKLFNLRAFSQSGRNNIINASLQTMFSRCLVTNPEVTENLVYPHPFPMRRRLHSFDRKKNGQRDFLLLEPAVVKQPISGEAHTNKQNVIFPQEALIPEDVGDGGPFVHLNAKRRKLAQEPAIKRRKTKLPDAEGESEPLARFQRPRNNIEEDRAVSVSEGDTLSDILTSSLLKCDELGTKRLVMSPEGPFAPDVSPHLFSVDSVDQIPIASEQGAVSHISKTKESQETPFSRSLTPVLTKINQLRMERNEDIISFFDLCPPASTSKRRAAHILSALLQLFKQREINLEQDREDDFYGPILIVSKHCH